MKNLSDLKPNEAIRVNKSEWPKLAELLDKEGWTFWSLEKPSEVDIFDKYWCSDSFVVIDDPKDKFISYTRSGRSINKLNKHLASEFLQPEPRFKVGQLVQYRGRETFRISDIDWDGVMYRYISPDGNIGYSESSLTLIEPLKKSEPLVPEYEIGQQYEFKLPDDTWEKGEFVGSIGHKDKKHFVARVTGALIVFDEIRPIQPTKIVRWVNVYSNGDVSDYCHESEKIAKMKAAHTDCKQVKLEGLC